MLLSTPIAFIYILRWYKRQSFYVTHSFVKLKIILHHELYQRLIIFYILKT